MRRRRRARHAGHRWSYGLSQWQQHREHRPSGFALEFDEAAIAGYQLLCHRETEAGAIGAAGDQRIEDARAQLFGNARAIVLDLQAGDEAMPGRSDADVGKRARAQHDPAAGTQRLQGVACHIEQRLDDLMAIERGARQARIVVALDLDRRGRLRAQQVIYVLAHLVHVDRRFLRYALRARHGVDQRRQPVRLADDDLGVLLQRSALQLALEELRRPAQAAKGIFDLMRELPDHEPTAVEARDQVVLARDALSLSGVGQLEEQVDTGDLTLERCDGNVERAGLARRAGRAEGELPVGDAFAGLERTAQDADQAVAVEHEVRERAAARLVEAEGEKILRRDVRVD